MPDRGYFFFDALFNGKGGLRKAKSLRTNISEMADLLMLNVRLTYVKQATHLCSSKYMLSYFFVEAMCTSSLSCGMYKMHKSMLRIV